MGRSNARALLTILLIIGCNSAVAAQKLPLDIRRALLGNQPEQAIGWLQTATAQGNSEAAFTLGKLHRLGQGVSRNQEKADHYFTLAARAGHTGAQKALSANLRQSPTDANTAIRPQAADPFELITHTSVDSTLPTRIDWHLINSAGETPLIFAAQTERWAWLTQLSANSKARQLNHQDKLGNTALHYAAGHGQRAATKTLLDAGADPNLGNQIGTTALHKAVAAGAPETARLLIRGGADTNITDNSGWSPVMLAERSGNSAFQFLLEDRPQRPSRKTAVAGLDEQLLRQVKQSDVKEVTRLLTLGADPNAVAYGKTAMQIAVSRKAAAAVAALLQAGASLEPSNSGDLLVTAIRNHDDASVASLLEHGASVVQADDKGRTPLWWAVSERQHTHVLVLLEHGAVVQQDPFENSPLHLAFQKSDTAIQKALLQHVAVDKLALASANGNGLLHLSARHDNAEVVGLLLAKGLPVDTENQTGDTPLVVAVRNDALQTAKSLIAAGASLNRRNQQNVSARGLVQQKDGEQWQQLLQEAPSEFASLWRRISED